MAEHAHLDTSALLDANRALARADATRRAQAQGWQRWAEWAGARGYAVLPAEPERLAECLVVHLAAERRLGLTSVAHTAWAVDQAHKRAGLAEPSKDAYVAEQLAGLRRQLAGSQRQAPPLSIVDIARMAWGSSPADLRDKALLLLGFAGALRRSELAALRTGDVEITAEGARVHVRRSKTDQTGQGATVWIGRSEHWPSVCPVGGVEAWISHKGPGDGPLFGITAHGVNRAVQRRCESIGLHGYTAHSLRAGCATYLAECGVHPAVIARHGRWSSMDMVLRYCRGDTANALKGAY